MVSHLKENGFVSSAAESPDFLCRDQTAYSIGWLNSVEMTHLQFNYLSAACGRTKHSRNSLAPPPRAGHRPGHTVLWDGIEFFQQPSFRPIYDSKLPALGSPLVWSQLCLCLSHCPDVLVLVSVFAVSCVILGCFWSLCTVFRLALSRYPHVPITSVSLCSTLNKDITRSSLRQVPFYHCLFNLHS